MVPVSIGVTAVHLQSTSLVNALRAAEALLRAGGRALLRDPHNQRRDQQAAEHRGIRQPRAKVLDQLETIYMGACDQQDIREAVAGEVSPYEG